MREPGKAKRNRKAKAFFFDSFNGVVLMELVVALTAGALIMASVGGLLVNSGRLSSRFRRQFRLYSEACLVGELFQSDIRSLYVARKRKDDSGLQIKGSEDEIAFQATGAMAPGLPEGTDVRTVTYFLQNQLGRIALMRKVEPYGGSMPGKARFWTIADGLSQVRFSYMFSGTWRSECGWDDEPDAVKIVLFLTRDSTGRVERLEWQCALRKGGAF